ncbi:MAG: AAA family ATPase, partial [Oligoflexia bacterium]|nr:AAA family ATPase [Oligoflexia bacterium]
MLNIRGILINEKIYESEKSIIVRGRDNEANFARNKKLIFKILKNKNPSEKESEVFNYEFKKAKICQECIYENFYTEYKNYDNHLTIVSEDFNGISLDKILATKQLNLKSFLEISLLLVQALNKIHSNNIIHLNLNPSNIIYNETNNILQIIDYALATLPSNQYVDIISGNPLYISPEQTGRINRSIDYRSDYYSLGIIFYEMLIGKVPFYSDDLMQIIHSHLAITAFEPYSTNKEIPKTVSDIVMKLIAKSPDDRYKGLVGLENDLKQCKESFLNTGNIANFQIASKDIPHHFCFSEKIYGRKNEIEKLTSLFKECCNGKIQIVFVKGESGIGKTALINEMNSVISKEKGFFLKGKFDQYKRNIPYSAFIEIFKNLICQLLTENNQNINHWKYKIINTLGNNCQVICDFIPELELIVGKQNKLVKLTPIETQNRFKITFQNFISIFISKEHPLVLFFDDLQWVDLSSISLLEYIFETSDINNFMLIGAYRDNELDETHPFQITLNKLENININYIQLNPITKNDLSILLAENLSLSLDSNISQIEELTTLCLSKTNANPLYVNHFLHALYDQKIFFFNNTTYNWDFDFSRIEQMNVMGSIAEFLLNKIDNLPKFCIEILKISSVVGNTFNTSIIAQYFKTKIDDIIDVLAPAFEEGLLFRLGTVEKNTFKFAHDRIQQVIYSQIDKEELGHIHIDIRQLIYTTS